MTLMKTLRCFFMSVRGAVFLAAAVVAAALLIAAGFPIIAAAGTALFIMTAGFILTLRASSGARSIAAENERRNELRNLERLAEAADSSKKLARMRLPDADLKSLAVRLCCEADAYIERCKNTPGAVYEPCLIDSILSAENAVDAFLKLKNRESSDRRLGFADSRKDERENDLLGAQAAKSEAVKILERAAAEIRERNTAFEAAAADSAFTDVLETKE